ncbi:MAG: glycogen debranching protein GlgX [Candidatus Limnocylindrales bacterium]
MTARGAQGATAPDHQPWTGEAYPLGATVDGSGTNFAVFSRVAERVELCLFDASGTETRLDLPRMTGFTWHGYLPGVGTGQRYGYRVHGPWDPSRGRRCNPRKLLLDPYARAIEGEVRWAPAVHGHVPGEPFRQQTTDSAGYVPRSIVMAGDFDWGDDARPRVPESETILYETHVKGFTKRHPGVPEKLRGTYAGLAHPAAIEHLVRLGVTSVELLPVHHFVHDGFLRERGLRQYWGYNTIGFFAPHAEYAAAGSGGGQVNEFKAMVKALHAAGLEVILDVVYNHTGEGNHRGPMLSFRGFDNEAYYRVHPESPRHYTDYTGTGNTLNVREPYVLQLIMDSLRYWIAEMHVDGFRFDLASALARELHEVDRLSSFFDIIQQDPVIRTVKLIAEPWDVGEGGYQVGNFPPHWAEWNGHYRDSMRDLWRGEADTLHDFGRRFTGSADLYAEEGRTPAASVNIITTHDGFTLSDLVTYNRKHNRANGDHNRDGESWNRSWNCGVEGPTDDPDINALRTRQRRNLLATLLLSQGVPMLLGGDEIGRTQHGNNNAYCQDSELSWFDWEHVDEDMLDFTRRLLALRREHRVFRRRNWFQVGIPKDGPDGTRDIEWCRPDGSRMADEDWHIDGAAAIAVYLSGDHLVDRHGQPIAGDSFYLALNATDADMTFRLPDGWLGAAWSVVFHTAAAHPFEVGPEQVHGPASELDLPARSLLLARRVEPR